MKKAIMLFLLYLSSFFAFQSIRSAISAAREVENGSHRETCRK